MKTRFLLVILSFSGGLLWAQRTREFKLESLSLKFQELIAADAKLEKVATGFVYVSDETINKIFRVFPDGKKEEVISLGDPDGNTFDRQHRLIDCASV